MDSSLRRRVLLRLLASYGPVESPQNAHALGDLRADRRFVPRADTRPRASPPNASRSSISFAISPNSVSATRSRGLFACFFFRSRPSVSDVLRLLLRKAPAELAQALEPELALLADEPPGRRLGSRRLLAPCGVSVAQSLGPHAWPTRLALLEGRARSLRVRQRRGAGEVGGTTNARASCALRTRSRSPSSPPPPRRAARVASRGPRRASGAG